MTILRETNEGRIAAARFLQYFSGFAQVVMMAALLIMWKQYQVPFWTAVERCFTIGVTIHILLNTIASFLLTLARVRPVALLLNQLSRFVSLLVYGALRYVYELGFLKSVAIWVVLYVVAGYLVGRIERRAGPRIAE